MTGLEMNELDHFSHLLTGYVGSVSFLEQVYKIVKQLKEKNPNLIYGKPHSKTVHNQVMYHQNPNFLLLSSM